MSIARLYAHTDPGAPVLTGQQGALKDLLKKILVGASGIAYGTGTNEKPALGWSIVAESTDKLVVCGEISSSQMLLRVDDSGSGAGSYREAFVFGCESATGVDTYASRFPTAVQLASGLVWRKSQNTNSTPTPWWLWGDGRTFHLMINYYGGNYAALYGFGDFHSAKAGDAFNCMIYGGTFVNASGTIPDSLQNVSIGAVGASTGSASYAARSYDQLTKSVALGHSTTWATNVTPGYLAGAPAYPAAIVNGLLTTPIFVHEIGMPRGRLRGIHAPLHGAGLTPWAAITGVSGMPGARLVPSATYNNSGTGIVIAETDADLT